MRIDIVTGFPEMIEAALDHSIMKRARDRGLVQIGVVNVRDFATDRHKTTDDLPYGGGGGMVMKVEPIAKALASIIGLAGTEMLPRVILTDPRGYAFTQAIARKWATEHHIVILCGHYEGVDDRVRQNLVTDVVSVGDYVLTGGELPALIMADALARLQPGALGDEDAPANDTFAEDLLEYPHFTRPRVYRDWAVPDILISGHHAQIQKWRRWHQLQSTRELRPDMFNRLQLSNEDRLLLESAEPEAPVDCKISKTRLRSARAEGRPESPASTSQIVMREENEETDGTGT